MANLVVATDAGNSSSVKITWNAYAQDYTISYFNKSFIMTVDLDSDHVRVKLNDGTLFLIAYTSVADRSDIMVVDTVEASAPSSNSNLADLVQKLMKY